MLHPSGHITVKLGTAKQQTFNQATMVGQSRHCPKAGQLGSTVYWLQEEVKRVGLPHLQRTILYPE